MRDDGQLVFVQSTPCVIRNGRQAAKLLSKDEARRIAVNIAKLPGLVRGKPKHAGRHTRKGCPNIDANSGGGYNHSLQTRGRYKQRLDRARPRLQAVSRLLICAKLLSKDEARRIAVNIAKLPELTRKQ